MNINKYLKMSSEALYSYLISDVMSNPEEGNDLIKKLSNTEKYKNDFEFRLSVDTTKAILLGMSGQNKKLLSLCTELIERAEALGMWQLLSTNWNLLGTAYAAIGIYERALECYFNVIKNEKKHDLIAMTSLAHNNISVIYTNFAEHEKTYKHCVLALKTLEKGGEEQPRYHSKMLLYLSNLIRVLSKMKKLDKIPPFIEKIQTIGFENATEDCFQGYYSAMMHYSFYSKNYEEGKNFFYKLKEIIGSKNLDHNLAALGEFIELCKIHKRDYSYYLNDLLSYEKLEESSRALLNLQVYRELKDYYESIKNKKSFDKASKKYIKFLELDLENIRKSQANSLGIVEDIIYDSQNMKEVISKNTELKLIAAEAIKHKNSLQEAYSKIEMINTLGQKLTSSLDLTEVIDSIYKNINNHLPITCFVLMVVEEEKQILRTVAYYRNDILQPEVCLNLKTDTGLFIEAYKKNIIISTLDENYLKLFQEQKDKQNDSSMESAIYMPLIVENKIIGLCSIQDKKKDIYTEEHIVFLEGLRPYLSIALNNAIRSWRLENEIYSHLKTQKKLQNANSKLKKLSSLDGLTQISSRRDFDSKMINLLKEAQKTDQPIAVLMLDIDKFKQYNDYYGHLEGDEALKIVAKIFRKNMDKVKGLSARFGGEEFIGACIGLSQKQCDILANTIRSDLVKLNVEHRGSDFGTLTVSIGVAISYHINTINKSEIMRIADLCLYEAKNTGRNKAILKII